VDAPVVLIFCKNPSRVKFDFPEYVLAKFAIQDATLAAGYSQLASQALGLSSIWIGMFDEKKVMDVIGTDLIPSSVLCIGYPEQTKFPKPRRNLKDLVHVVW
jgi:nitroreductase